MSSFHSPIHFLPYVLIIRLPSPETLSILQTANSLLQTVLPIHLGTNHIENAVFWQFLFCYRGVFTSPLHRNVNYSIVVFVYIFAGTYLPSLPSNELFRFLGVMSQYIYLIAPYELSACAINVTVPWRELILLLMDIEHSSSRCWLEWSSPGWDGQGM
jgi:hypothetical protein